MYVKWHEKISTKRKLNGGGPQGGTFVILEFLSQRNKNANSVDKDGNGLTISPDHKPDKYWIIIF